MVWILFKLTCINNVMFSETGKQFWKEFGIDTWWTGDTNQHFSFIYNWSASQRNYSTSKELEQGKNFIKQILIGKADKVCSEQFLSLLWNPRAYQHMYQTSTTIFAVKHQNVFVHFQDETNNNQWSITWSYDSKWMIRHFFLGFH